MKNSTWSGRAFTSLCSLVSFILLCLTGILLFIEPQGRVAYWTNWRFLGLEKDQWGNIHIYSGLLFLLAGGFHIYYNWKPLVKYLSGKVESALRYKREMVISGIIFLWILVSGVWSLPPLSYVTDLGGVIKDSWVTSPELEPPFGHAELASLKTFCKKQGIPLDQAMKELRGAGFRVDDPKETLAEIAASKETSGMSVYAVIKKLESQPGAVTSGSAWTPEKIEEAFSGTGLGRKTLGQVIKDLGVNPEAAHKRLMVAGIEAGDEDKIKDLAEKHDSTPIKILTIVLVENTEK